MLVSVIMGVYNGERTVRSAVESIVGQSFRDWEFLIVDDGSTDGTRSILGALAGADPRIRILPGSRRRGLAVALNEAWRASRGEWIARMDADDWSMPDRLRQQVEFLCAHPEVDVLGTGFEAMDASGAVLGSVSRTEWHEEITKKMYFENPFAHPSVMMRRRFLDELCGYDPRSTGAEDLDLWLRGYRRFRYHNLPQPLIRYRLRLRPKLSSGLYGSFVLFRSAVREGLLLSRGWCALRPISAALASRAGVLRNPYGVFSAPAGRDSRSK